MFATLALPDYLLLRFAPTAISISNCLAGTIAEAEDDAIPSVIDVLPPPLAG
jgi:hypothetical protein